MEGTEGETLSARIVHKGKSTQQDLTLDPSPPRRRQDRIESHEPARAHAGFKGEHAC